MADLIQLEIVTPEKMVVNDQASEVQIPGATGYLGVLPGHAPLITELAVGAISYRDAQGGIKRLAVAWGFAEVLPDKVTILAEVAERAEDIDVERARKAKESAETALKTISAEDAPDKQATAQSELQRAENRIDVAEKLNAQIANLVP